MIDLERPRDISALFGDSLAVFFRHAPVFLALAAVVAVPVNLVVEGFGQEAFTAGYDESLQPVEAVVPTVVSFLVVSPLITAICIHALRSIAAGGRPGARTSLVSGFEAFTPLFFAVVIEGARGPAALTRSSEVVRGFWWRTFGLVILANLAATIPTLVFTAPFTAIAASTDRAVWSMVGTICAETITTPFVALFATLLWYDLLARRAPEPEPLL